MLDNISYFFLRSENLHSLPEFLVANNHKQEIIIYINCTGGDVLPALESVNLIQANPNKVTTVINGCAESSGLLVAISGHDRHIFENSWGMAHSFSTSIEGSYHDIKDVMKHNEMLHKAMFDIYKHHTNATEDVINTHLIGRETTWLTEKEMLNLGMVDKIISIGEFNEYKR